MFRKLLALLILVGSVTTQAADQATLLSQLKEKVNATDKAEGPVKEFPISHFVQLGLCLWLN